jgi:hypothetical protein
MKFRIAICAGLGFLAAVGWALYSFSAFPSPITPAEPIVWNLALLTQPIVLASFRFHFGIGVYWVILANTLRYGLIGLTRKQCGRSYVTHIKSVVSRL